MISTLVITSPKITHHKQKLSSSITTVTFQFHETDKLVAINKNVNKNDERIKFED